MQNFTQAYTKGWTYVRMIFSETKFSYPWCSAARASREGSAIILFWHTDKDGPQILNIDSIVCLTLRMQITITAYLPSWHQVLAVPHAHRWTCSLRQPGLLQSCVSKRIMLFLWFVSRLSKGRTELPEGFACPIAPSMGSIIAGRGRVISGRLVNSLGSRFGTSARTYWASIYARMIII